MAVTSTKTSLGLQDLLVNYFKQHHFNRMSANVRAKFNEHVDNNDLVGNMKDWKTNLWVKDGEKDPTEILKALSDDDLIELYKDIRARLQRLPENPAVYKNGKMDDDDAAVKFYNEYFGNDNMFHESSVDGRVKPTIDKLFNSTNQDVKTALNTGLAAVKKSASNSNNKYTLDELKKRIDDEDYNKDPEFRKDLQTILSATYRDLYYSNESEPKSIRYELSELVSNGFDPNPSQFEIDSFRAELPEILNQVYGKKKVRETIFANSDIVAALNTARDKVDYDKPDSECFIKGKMDDQLTVMQRLKKEVTDKYEDYLEKYLHGGYDHLYKSREAREIMGAIKKVGIKKTEGLDKILEKASDIKTKAVGKMKKAGPQFDWIVKEFTKLKADMPQAFSGCLNNGFQLSRIVQQMIMDAVDQDKMDEAKTAMELLVVMQYGNTTSGLMDKIRGDKELFTVFSNKDLSWNKKSEAVAFVSGALDKTFRIGALAVGYGLTFVYNNVRQLGASIKDGDGNKFFKSERDKWANNNEEKARQEAALGRAKDRIKIYRKEVGLTGSGIKGKKAKEDFLKNKLDNMTKERDFISSSFLEPNDIQKELGDLTDPKSITYAVADLYTSGKITEDVKDLAMNYITDVKQALNDGAQVEELPPIPSELLTNSETADIFGDLKEFWFDADKNAHKMFKEKQDKIDRFNSAINELRRAEEQRDRYKKQIDDFDVDKKNKFDKLVKHWNELLTDSRLFGEQQNWLGSTKNAQKAYFDQLKARAA